ncbi:MAG: hypothetical protein LBU34_16190 [Planctomycetaceae bacterium]|nr:hypothetical protein [Planctomycetaceae bacterium]
MGRRDPAVALRSTAGYAHHTQPVRGFMIWGILIRRLRCASPPVMHITPLAGLRFRLP